MGSFSTSSAYRLFTQLNAQPLPLEMQPLSPEMNSTNLWWKNVWYSRIPNKVKKIVEFFFTPFYISTY